MRIYKINVHYQNEIEMSDKDDEIDNGICQSHSLLPRIESKIRTPDNQRFKLFNF